MLFSPPMVEENASNRPVAGESSPLSLDRLRAAFAQMLGTEKREDVDQSNGPGGVSKKPQGRRAAVQAPAADTCEVSPRTVVEALLFVGRPDGSTFTPREMAAAMRGVSPTEIDVAIAELNAAYARDQSPYAVVGSSQSGYRLALSEDLNRMRDKLRGRTREARLTPAAVEVLSIVAYNQPTSAAAVSELRGSPCGAVLASLVRRKLIRVDRRQDDPGPPSYSTTDRFLQLFNLESPAALPRSEELEKL